MNLRNGFYPVLSILIDGELEIIPADLGLVKTCMAEIHTHDTSGTIHVESFLAGKEFFLKDFFVIFGEKLERPGFVLSMKVDGGENMEFENLKLLDKQEIELSYQSNGNREDKENLNNTSLE